MQVQNCTKHSPARQGEECPKCQIDHLRAVNTELLEALETWLRAYDNHVLFVTGPQFTIGDVVSTRAAILRAKG